MYSLGHALQKEPVVLAGAIRSLLWLAVLLGWVQGLDEAALAGIALVAEIVLGLFARQASTPMVAPRLPAGTSVAVEGTNDTVEIQPTPPGPTGDAGGQDEDPDEPTGGGALTGPAEQP
jgi:hypothetical protein